VNRPEAAFPDLPRYEVRERAGEGATALVYRAWDRELNRAVALKVLKQTAGLNEITRQRFRREAQAAAAVAHPNVVQVYDAGEHQGQLFLVMELVEGRLLSDLLIEGKTSRKDVVRIVERAARGVAAAHGKGVVHRDLKPGNILLDRAGEPKVGDFGLAHLVDSTTELTRTGSTLGTPLYMAPEQVDARPGDITPRTDVYALGAILYEASTGYAPHSGQTVMEIYSKIVNQDPVRPRRLEPAIAGDLETIILKSLDKDPSRRYPDAGALADDLRRWLEGEPIRARPVGTARRLLRKAVRRREIVLPTATAVLLALALGAWVVGGGVHRRSKAREHRDRGFRLEEEGRIEEARDAFLFALERDPSSAAAAEGLRRADAAIARRRQELADREEAQRILENIRPALDRAARSFYDRQADPAEIRRRVEEARAAIEQACARAPGLAPAHFLAGRAWELLGWDDRAAEAYRRTIGLQRDHGPAHYHLGRLLLARAYLVGVGATPAERDARRPEAEKVAREAAAAIESAVAAEAGLEDALQREGARAMLAYTRRDFDEVLRIAREGLERFKGKEGVEELHWLAGLSSGGAEELSALDQAIALRPKYALALFSRAIARFPRGEFTEALADLGEALRAHPRLAEAWYNRGVVRSVLRDHEGAVADFDEALRIRPGDAGTLNNRGVAKANRGDIQGAIDDYDAALRADPRFADAYGNRGVARSRKGDLEGAIADFTKVIEADPKLAEPFYNRGIARSRKALHELAIADFSRAIEIRPAWGSPH
jgi:tetratricopeptide (TPR) repeat protein/tRNA A-37 threonylcarbamoyl transferase component Bud32